MGTETLRPDGELSDSGLVANTAADHDEDPDVSSVTINATGNNTNTEWGGDFPAPTGNPTGLQTFRVGVLEFDGGQTGTPTARVELWEGGSLVRAGPEADVSTYAVLELEWDASELSGDGSLVQCKLIGTKAGGGPSKRNTVRIGHMEWNVTYSAAAVTTQKAINFGMVTGMATTPAPTFVKTINVTFTTAMTVSKLIRKTLSVGFATGFGIGKTVGVTKAVSFVTGMSTATALMFTKAISFSIVTSMSTSRAATFGKSISVGFVTTMSIAKQFIAGSLISLHRVHKRMRCRMGL